MAIDVPVCVDWFLTCQRDKMSFLERSQWLGAFQNCFRVRCEVSIREIPSAKKKKDGAALTARESACEERNRLKVSLLTRVLFSRVYYLSRWNHAPFNTSDVLFWGETYAEELGRDLHFWAMPEGKLIQIRQSHGMVFTFWQKTNDLRFLK